jgi:hypothetical protein
VGVVPRSTVNGITGSTHLSPTCFVQQYSGLVCLRAPFLRTVLHAYRFINEAILAKFPNFGGYDAAFVLRRKVLHIFACDSAGASLE